MNWRATGLGLASLARSKNGASATRARVFTGLAVALGALFAAMGASADELNMPVGVTEISRQVYDLHMTIFWICVAIGVVVFGMMFIAILMHRKSMGHEPAQFFHSTKVEIAWTIVPFLILIVMAIPATNVLIAMYDTGGEDMEIEVRGYQWKWEYKYLDENRQETVSFFSNLATPKEEIYDQSAKGEFYLLEVDNPLVIPINKKVRFLVTANDVLHAWWVPEFGIKRDAIPGILNELWAIAEEPGIYRGQCTELCGKDHGFMPIVVRAVPQAEFDEWYAAQRVEAEEIRQCVNQEWTPEKLMTKGEEVYGTFCASCHGATGAGVPPVFPALKGSKIALGPKEDHIDMVVNGVGGSAMQAFGSQLDPCSMAAVIHYERNSWGNNTGDVTMPQDVIDFQN